MYNLYNVNGLMFWSQEEILLRDSIKNLIVSELITTLKSANSAFELIQVEAPLLTPSNLINANYTSDDVFQLDDLTLRPETTMGSYVYAEHLLNPHNKRKVRLPLVVWQHGKSFRIEQDKTISNMRLKEFYQLEFQIIYSSNTKMDYSTLVIPSIQGILTKLLGETRTEDSDRLPSYSTRTVDIIHDATNMEVCSISNRTDYEDNKVLEVAIGTDRCVYLFNKI